MNNKMSFGNISCFIFLILLQTLGCHGDFFSDLDKLDIDSKLRAIDDVISSIDEDEPKPSGRKRKFNKAEDTLGDAVEALTDMFGEECNYKCENGNSPISKPGHVTSSNGCGSYGIKIDVEDLPGMETCCDNHDICYDTCNNKRKTCDKTFKTCLNNMCDKIKALQLSKVSHKECKMAADMMYSGSVALGCDSYLKAQENACTCSNTQKSKPSQQSRNVPDEL
ncbi:hypothetical protein ACF0H5_000428 [Mactra antiquata]